MAIAQIKSHEPASIAGSVTALPTINIAVQLDNVVKRFGDLIAVHEVSLNIQEGEFVSLLGPSGCGKTTLLNLMGGFAEADHGEIIIDGQRGTGTARDAREVGVVFQDYARLPLTMIAHMPPPLTVAGDIGRGLQMRGVPEGEIAQRVEQALALVRLPGYGERPPCELSSGQQQRVALARALVIRPGVLLLDEPFSALDKHLRLSMLVELKDIQRKFGVTIVLVTDDPREALSMSDRVVVMSAGEIRQIGTPDAIYRHPENPFVARFIGEVNRLPGRYLSRDERAALAMGDSVLRLPAERVHADIGARVDIYVRPENIRLGPLGPETLLSATVVTHVFQGDHIDVHLDVPALGQTRVFVRQSGLDAMTRWPIGTAAGLSFDDEDVFVFAAVVPPLCRTRASNALE